MLCTHVYQLAWMSWLQELGNVPLMLLLGSNTYLICNTIKHSAETFEFVLSRTSISQQLQHAHFLKASHMQKEVSLVRQTCAECIIQMPFCAMLPADAQYNARQATLHKAYSQHAYSCHTVGIGIALVQHNLPRQQALQTLGSA